ncbi:MAG TPA: hypothetical protein VGK64_15085 [Bryobacteraceae bacterium]
MKARIRKERPAEHNYSGRLGPETALLGQIVDQFICCPSIKAASEFNLD